MTLCCRRRDDARAAESVARWAADCSSRAPAPLKSHEYVTWINAGKRPRNLRDLYANLRALDSSGCEQFSCRTCPAMSAGAVRDR